jgi:hypothetical protein
MRSTWLRPRAAACSAALTASVALAALATPLAAQQSKAQKGMLPSDVRREVVARWNGANALRATGRLELAAGRDVVGNLAIAGGPLVLAGHIEGRVTAVNATVVLGPTARIDGDLLVVGGDVEGRNAAQVAGAIRIYREPLVYHEVVDKIVDDQAADSAGENESWLSRIEHRHEGNWTELLRVVQAGPYNRVEGLPIELGPVVNRLTPWGSFRVDAAAVVRTGSTFRSSDGGVGHRIRGEVRVGRDRGVGIGGQAINVVDAVESWQLSDLETALAAFLVRRDYRDYYQRHGGSAFVTLYGASDVSLTGSFGEERWSSAPLRNPFTLFNGDRAWRPNPRVDEGLFHVATATFNLDTRTDPDDPWSGWYVNAELEHGAGAIASVAPTSEPRPLLTGEPIAYTRGLFDVRRYNRLGPNAQLNARLIAGGWLGGDELPLERRLSVDGPGALPGFDFRSPRAGLDVGTCNSGVPIPGRPAECDRVALAQLELRGDLPFDLTSGLSDWPHRYHGGHGDAVWVVFADAGRGWNVGPGASATALGFGTSTIPPFPSFRTDVGAGLDIGGIGLYAAKSTSRPSEPLNLFIRLRHRF